MPTVPISRIDSGTRPREKMVFLTAARFENQKDYQTLAKAVRRVALACPGQFELHIYGDGPQEQQTRELFSGIEAPIIFKGFIEDITVALKGADVFILSSHWEGLPRSIIEAMSCRLPVIATDVGGVKELVVHGHSGYLVGHANDEAMVDAMVAYIKNEALWRAHAESSYARFNAEFTLEKMLDKYVQAYLPETSGAPAIAKSVRDV